LHFDFAFWHQGSSDIGTDANDYFNRLTIVVEYIDKNVDIGRWVIALHSRCSGLYDASIENAQRQFASVAGANRFIGPNNNILDNTYRIDGCHLTQGGQEMMAGMWYDSMKNALGYK
jgi:lysophospholipase L1-like esterase